MINFDSKIDKFVKSYKDMPFVWGKYDCTNFIVDWISYYHNIDLYDELESYDTESEAMAILNKRGFDNQDDLMDYYFTRIPKHKLSLGDMVGFKFSNSDIIALGIYTGVNAVFKDIGQGVIAIPYSQLDADMNWRIK